MRGKDKVIAHLNEALRSELTAINQYFLHAEMCENWGYQRIGEVTKKRSIDEMRHAENLIGRILFLDGAPNLGMGLQIKPGATVKAQLEADLELEHEAFEQYNASARVCTEEGDNTSAELFKTLLAVEEKHIDFLEAQLNIIKETGVENYLIKQTKTEG